MKHRLILFFILVIQLTTIQAQYSIGMTGQLNIPTAEVQRTGTFMGGGNFLPKEIMLGDRFTYNTGNYFVNLTIFSILEINYRCTLLKTGYMAHESKLNNQDRASSIKIRVLKESKYYPAFALGVNDPDENNDMQSSAVYGVITKNLLSSQTEHQVAVTLGYYHPLKNNSRQEGIFGGIRYIPAFMKPLSVMAEYDSKGFNVGATAKFWNRLSLHLFTREFKCISGGIRYEYTLIL
ncbi:MAG: YjbH domain-containing protein [Bacteroides sp.]|nr:YjbH domain-containing protein [Bacteroides sp.]